MNKTLVTIAIPYYNTEKYLAFAIQSVINQTYRNWELLLIDDGGTDSSYDIAKSYADQDSRIRIIKDGQNKGLPTRLNESVCEARGTFYARMDDDDIMTVDRIEKQVDYLLTHPEVDVIGSSAMRISATNGIVNSIDMTGKDTGFVHPTVMARTQWFRDNPYDATMKRSQDLDLWLRTFRNSKFHNIPEPLLFYRDVGIPTRQKYAKSMRCVRQIAMRYKSYGKSLTWGIKLWCNCFLKQIVYNLFGIIGQIDVLIKHRSVDSVPESLSLTELDLRQSVSGVVDNIIALRILNKGNPPPIITLDNKRLHKQMQGDHCYPRL